METLEPTENIEVTAGANVTAWTESVKPLRLESLNENLETDVVVVGAGIAGISVAYNLVREGKKVIVVEDGNVGSGETGRTTAHLVTALDDRYFHLEKLYGAESTRLIAASHRKAIEFIKRTVENEKIDCDFEMLDGFLFLHPTDEKDVLDRELRAALKAGLEVEKINFVPGMKNAQKECLKFSGQAQFHPLKYVNALAGIICNSGGKIFTHTHAKDISSTGVVTDKGFEIKAKSVVVATNSPVNNKFVLHLKQYGYQTYVIAAKIKTGSIAKALWWDTGDHSVKASMPPYHYVRLERYNETHDLLICGGEDHPTGLLPDENATPEEDRYAVLESWAKEHFDIEEIVYKWSGEIMEPMDSLAFIGKNPLDHKNVFVVTGDSGNGLTHGTIAGMLITDLIVGRKNDWEKIYEPSRFKLFTAGKTFFKEVGSGLAQYMKDKPKDFDADKIYALQKGDGTVVMINKSKLGVFRDEKNDLHFVSAECTHLGCMVKWNKSEKSWDCPCHGSRFAYNGKVMHGPANKDLDYYMENGEKLFSKQNTNTRREDLADIAGEE